MKKRLIFILVFVSVLAGLFIWLPSGVPTNAAVRISAKTLHMAKGQTYKLKLKNAKSSKKAVWSSSDSTVASVKKGKVTAKKEGSATISVKYKKKTFKCSVIVSDGRNDSETAMRMKIGNTEVTVKWEENESVAALREMAKTGPVTISMSMYGGFEQVGPIGKSLPRNDVQTSTSAGDIVLYSGDKMVIFYGSNSWSYTRLGKITGMDGSQLKDLLSGGDVTVVIEN